MWLATCLLGPDGYGRLVAVFAASQCVGQITLQWSAVSVAEIGYAATPAHVWKVVLAYSLQIFFGFSARSWFRRVRRA